MNHKTSACVVWAVTVLPAAATLVTYDVGDYVQDGLVVHLDGIRNIGASQAHDPNSDTWVNLASGGVDFTFVAGAGVGDVTGGWTEDGFAFVTNVYAQSEAKITFGASMTWQMACDVGNEIDNRSDAALFPAFVNCSEKFVSLYTRMLNGKHRLEWRNDWMLTSTYDNTKRALLPEWNGLNCTAISDGESKTAWLFSGDGRASCGTGGEQTGDTARSIGARTWYVGGNPPDHTRDGMRGIIHAVRLYDRALTDAEVALNNRIDRFRFRGERAVTNVVVATARSGLMGAENGNCQVEGSHTFTAPASVTAPDGCSTWSCAGYRLEVWNEGTGWGAPEEHAGESSYAYTVGTSPAKVRLTWLWKRGGGIVTYDADDYVAEELDVNFDAIRNVGLGAAHDSSAAKWLDCADTGRSISFSNTVDSTAGWSADRYRAERTSFGEFSEKVFLAESATIQLVLADMVFDTTMAYPTFFARPDDNIAFYTRGTSTKRKPEWKHYGEQQPRAMFDNWDGLYLNAVMTASDFYLSQNAVRENRVTSLVQAAHRNVTHTFNIGSENSKDLAKCYADCSYHAVRIYNHALTEWELAHNRVVDEARFRGALPATNVVVAVADSSLGFEGTEACGSYQIGESHMFTASRQRKGGVSYRVEGYMLETWNPSTGTWTDPVFVRSDRYEYRAGVSPDRVRITWSWTCGLLLFLK